MSPGHAAVQALLQGLVVGVLRRHRPERDRLVIVHLRVAQPGPSQESVADAWSANPAAAIDAPATTAACLEDRPTAIEHGTLKYDRHVFTPFTFIFRTGTSL